MNIKELDSKKLYKEYLLQIPFEEVDSSINDKIKEKKKGKIINILSAN